MKDEMLVAFIIDRSGSMAGKELDTIGGFDAFIEEQKKQPKTTKITTTLFDDQYEILYNLKDVRHVPSLKDSYVVRGYTALYDAIGKTIGSIGNELNARNENDRPDKVKIIIITDGFENASIEFTAESIKNMIKEQTEKYSWEFVFMGTNQDAALSGSTMGISSANCVSYSNTGLGTQAIYRSVMSFANTGENINIAYTSALKDMKNENSK